MKAAACMIANVMYYSKARRGVIESSSFQLSGLSFDVRD